MAEKINSLERWKRHFDDLSSKFHVSPVARREHVELIYQTLKECWGDAFFEVNFLDAIHSNKVHFLHPLLGQPSKSTYYYLFEVTVLIDYAKQKHPSLYQSFYEVRYVSAKAKEALFEIYIAATFERNQTAYRTDVWIDNQPIDGICTIGTESLLVECKKKYSVIEPEIAMRTFLMAGVLKMAKSITYGLECIGIIHIKQGSVTRQSVTPVLKLLKNYLVNRKEYSVNHVEEDDYIRCEIKPYDIASRIELENDLIPYTIYFTITNLHYSKDDKPQFRVQTYFKTFADSKKVAAKLIDAIKKARSQHAGQSQKRIFFVDNEMLNDFASPLLHNNKRYERHVQNFLEKSAQDDVVVLLYRNFSGPKPTIHVSVLGKESTEAIKFYLQQLNFYTLNPDKFRPG